MMVLKCPRLLLLREWVFTQGNIVGKEAVGKYWVKSLQKHPELKFVLQDVYVGVDTIIVHYTNVGNRMVCESFRFNSFGKVIAAASHHGSLL